jgi:hypothetical protein
MMPPNMVGSGTQANPGTGVSGQASCQRTSSARIPPITSENRPMARNCFPIILWSVEKK